ncbi:hypothetical protein C8R44DRAFT_747823 [Mycena epipterygia]|nr:hypothetical protein C8R44DRAFT_747823 [Mycena epipterygia]
MPNRIHAREGRGGQAIEEKFQPNPSRTERDMGNSFVGIKNSSKWIFFGRAFGTANCCKHPSRLKRTIYQTEKSPTRFTEEAAIKWANHFSIAALVHLHCYPTISKFLKIAKQFESIDWFHPGPGPSAGSLPPLYDIISRGIIRSPFNRHRVTAVEMSRVHTFGDLPSNGNA